ncbi:MAG: DUF4124 domain-containing protein [Pseudomonadota bacterium]
MRYVLALVALLILPSLGQAAIYKWVDSKGVTHYTETPPPAGKVEEIQPRVTQPPMPETVAPPSEAEVDKDANGKPAEEGDAAKPKEMMTLSPEQLTKQCQDARQRLQQLETSPRLLTRTPDGQMQRVPEEERQRMMDEERKRIELYCE